MQPPTSRPRGGDAMRQSVPWVQVALVLVCSILLVCDVSAQSLTPRVAPSIGMGVAIPYRRPGEEPGTGLTAMGSVDLSFSSVPVLLQPELSYTRFTDAAGRDDHQISGSLNLVATRRHRRISPFVILGAGVYHLAASNRIIPSASPSLVAIATGGPPENDIGINAGGGVEFSFGSARGRLDARYRRVLATRNRFDTYFPLTLSFRF
jgi:hypothetical protein